MRARARPLAGSRLHLQDGPIDLVIGADGPPDAVERAYAAATARFATILDELCAELPLLRAPSRPGAAAPEGAVARRMAAAVAPYAGETFVTPMAAVAGSVAEAVLRAMTAAAPLRRACVNNGGDIALHLAPGESYRAGLVDRPDAPALFGTTTIRAEDPIRGIATSGRRGRSLSRGIADAVTILAATAAAADAAATIVANAVDLPGHPAIDRVPAHDLRCDSDLGAIIVTRDVGVLSSDEIAVALERGRLVADGLVARGLVVAAALHLQGRTVGTVTHDRHAEEARHAPSRSTHDRLACFATRPSGAPQHDEWGMTRHSDASIRRRELA